jgi:ABC-type nitrate/sulfonate/bicarbonate transport system substrate-binding protein
MSRTAPLRPAIRAAAVVLLLAAGGAISPLCAAEKLRVGKAVPEAFSFVPLDIGMRKGFFTRNRLEVESTAFAGDARMQQAMASDSLDIALGSGPAMAFIVKGSPIKAVAAMAGSAAPARHRGATRWPEECGRPQGQEDQRIDRGLAYLLAGE